MKPPVLILLSLALCLIGCVTAPESPAIPRVVGAPLPEPDVLGGPAEPRISSDRPVRDFVDNLRFRVGLSGKGIAAEAVLPNDLGAGVKLYLVTPIDSELGPVPPPQFPVEK